MAWKIEFSSAARKEFNKLGHVMQRDIRAYIDRLQVSDDPRSAGKPLKGKLAGIWRYRVDRYRILCKIEDAWLTIVVVRVGKRDKVYD